MVWLEFKGLTPEFQVPPQILQFIGMPHVVFAPSCGQSQTCLNYKNAMGGGDLKGLNLKLRHSTPGF